MRYLSVCSGIEAATVAWHPLGWTPVAFAEVDRFPSAVLAHHYPDVPNLGDMTKFKDWPDATVDVLVGGTPCQSFSLAGLRSGLADPRGNLALTFLALADRYRPKWVVWENVPGVLSSTSHRAPDPCPPPPPLDLGCDGAAVDTEDEYDAIELHAFNCLLAGFSELGYFGAYGTLDAQYFGLAQRRKRVFAVFHLGDWHRAAAVLFDRTCLSGHPAPRREAGQVAPTIPSRRSAGGGLGTDFDCDGGIVSALDASYGRLHGCSGQDANHGHSHLIAQAFGGNDTRGPIEVATALLGSGRNHQDFESETFIAHSLKADGFNASEDGTGRGTPIVPVTFDDQRGRDNGGFSFDQARTLHSAKGPSEVQLVAFQSSQSGMREVDTHATLDANNGSRRHNGVVQHMAVRRLTPRECCRLQGFPDDYLDISYRGKPAADGNKYKALGNSMAIPVMRRIGERIAQVERIP